MTYKIPREYFIQLLRVNAFDRDRTIAYLNAISGFNKPITALEID